MKKLLCWLFLVTSAGLVVEAQAQTGIVAFSQSSYSVADDTGTDAINVSMTGTPTGNSTVDYSATGAVTANGTLNFTTNVFTSAFVLNIPTGLTTNLLVHLTLQNPTGSAVLGGLTNVVLTITPSDTGSQPFDTAHIFPIALKAFLTTESEDDDTVVKLKFNQRALTTVDRLVLVLDPDEHTISLCTVNSDNELSSPLAESTTAAFLSNGQFGGNLFFEDVSLINDTLNMSGTGDVHIKGTIVIDSATGAARLTKAILLGVFNDSVNGNASENDALIKGTITPAGKEYNLDDISF